MLALIKGHDQTRNVARPGNPPPSAEFPDTNADSVAPKSPVLDTRFIEASERRMFGDHLQRLPSSCRRSRFGFEVSDQWLNHYAGRTDLTNTVIIGCFDNAVLRGVAELRSFHPQWSTDAEAAFSVEPAFRRIGIGTRLLRAAIEAAMRLHVSRIHMIFAAHNRPMDRLARKFAASVESHESERIARVDCPSVLKRSALAAIEPPGGMLIAASDFRPENARSCTIGS